MKEEKDSSIDLPACLLARQPANPPACHDHRAVEPNRFA
jgi:hypothetical protein